MKNVLSSKHHFFFLIIHFFLHSILIPRSNEKNTWRVSNFIHPLIMHFRRDHAAILFYCPGEWNVFYIFSSASISDPRSKIVLLHIILTKYKINIRCHGVVFSYFCTKTQMRKLHLACFGIVSNRDRSVPRTILSRITYIMADKPVKSII